MSILLDEPSFPFQRSPFSDQKTFEEEMAIIAPFSSRGNEH